MLEPSKVKQIYIKKKMQTLNLHSWNVTPKEAVAIQTDLASQVVRKNDFKKIEILAGADLALDPKTNIGFAGVIIYEYPSLKEIERVWAKTLLSFPYIPGLLSFREAPLLLKAFELLKTRPDVILFDGQGIAHPRRLGIASHMGLLLGVPTIGCAKSILVGHYENLNATKESRASLTHNNETVGVALRTRDNTQPIFISVGHKIDLPTSVEIVLSCLDGKRIPKPTREADQFVAKIKQNLHMVPSTICKF